MGFNDVVLSLCSLSIAQNCNAALEIQYYIVAQDLGPWDSEQRALHEFRAFNNPNYETIPIFTEFIYCRSTICW